ncbi:MAG: alpha/beta fold hydrolase [Dehalococcoidia bacterium]
MVTAATTHIERTIDIAGLTIRALEGGSGSPLVVLHHSNGNPGWLPIHELLANGHAVLAPDLPGYGQSTRPEWAREPRDIAILMNQALDRLELTSGVSLVGLGFGGFIAAEMASMDQRRLQSLTLVGAAGIQPSEGEILDQMLVDFEDYVKAGFSNDAAYEHVFGTEVDPAVKQLWDFSREMTARLAWKPYMFNRRLPELLREVQTPTLLIWGSRDVIVPLSAAHRYKASLPNARLEVVEGAGHLVELEQPERVAELVAAHVASR